MTPGPLKIINSDYRIFFAVIAAVSAILLIPLEEYFGVMSSLHSLYADPIPADDRLSLPEFLTAVLPYAAAILLVYVALRMLGFYSIYWKSSVIIGVITEVPAPAIGMGSLKYEYLVDGRNYQVETLVRRSRAVKALSQGQEIEIIVNNRHPDKSFIRLIYT